MADGSSDVPEVLRVLTRHGVGFILIGGQAAVLLGSPIITWDFDACYERSEENLHRLVAALRDLQARLRVAGMSDEEAEDLPFRLDVKTLTAGLNFTFRTRAGAVDLLGQPAGVSGYSELLANSSEIEIFGMHVRVCGLEDLMTMKRHAGRPKDKAQLAELTALRDELERRDPRAGGVLKRARKRAIDQGTSVNAVLRDYLHSYAGDSQSARAAKEFLHLSDGSPADSGPAGRSWTREEVYDDALQQRG